MIYVEDLLMFLCSNACNTTVYLQNKSPHRVLEDKTLEEMFTGKRSKVSHLRIFSSPVYVHISMKKKTELESSSEKGIFVGYSEVSKAYMIYIPR